MLAKSELVRPQGLRPRARAPTCPLRYAIGYTDDKIGLSKSVYKYYDWF